MAIMAIGAAVNASVHATRVPMKSVSAAISARARWTSLGGTSPPRNVHTRVRTIGGTFWDALLKIGSTEPPRAESIRVAPEPPWTQPPDHHPAVQARPLHS